MKFFKNNTDRLLLGVVVVLLFMNLFNKRYQKTSPQPPKITVVKDTVWQTKIDTFTVQTVKYQKVYVHKNDLTKVVKDTIFIKDTTNYVAAKIYRDTLKNTDIEIYNYDLVQGKLLDSQLSYKLKVPREITITKTIEHPKTYRSGLYLFSEIGGNTQGFDNLSFGLQYNRQGRWFASYRLNINQFRQPTHNVGVGYRLFN
ncbi:hypothetical protein P8625_10805 [Tenacibaculum tangerinum]|uniref:Uncharacterized protein n=1 Tax=Tenacibaculum tangerinum TaxID=3038772 RepID=A0ABY8L301_9FLAO|nr:hypothetical protein [Tenacibaculum tangerinum]WGH74578.1 hypothetical protein P8625_10805 [Tenacibaculum tangerinum]